MDYTSIITLTFLQGLNIGLELFMFDIREGMSRHNTKLPSPLGVQRAGYLLSLRSVVRARSRRACKCFESQYSTVQPCGRLRHWVLFY